MSAIWNNRDERNRFQRFKSNGEELDHAEEAKFEALEAARMQRNKRDCERCHNRMAERWTWMYAMLVHLKLLRKQSHTPPFVPGGTFFQGFVTSLGSVSPTQHAKNTRYDKVSWSPISANKDGGIATDDLPKSKGPSLLTIALLVQAKITRWASMQKLDSRSSRCLPWPPPPTEDGFFFAGWGSGRSWDCRGNKG